MEIAPLDNSNVIKESSSSQQSSVSEFEKDVGNAHVVSKSASFEAEESQKMISESVNQSMNESVSKMVSQTFPTDETEANFESAENEKPSSCSDALSSNEIYSNQNEDEIEKVTQLTRAKLAMTDRQTSTTSLEEQHTQTLSNAEVLLALLEDGRGEIGSRPHSLPANLAHLWQSLKISCELNKKFGQCEEVDENIDNQEASGHKVNVDDGLRCKPIDLDKLFTPASDSGELTPARRKMFSSSSFYGPNHPTMEEQVDLARRISNSLSDISNRESKGQSMYVNRKKRSVKWVHEGEGKNIALETENLKREPSKESKPILKLVMDPRGKIQDLNSLRKQGLNIEPPMSPESCFDIVRDLNAPRGKGAELFAKRRKKSENWVVDENNVKSVETYQTTMHQNSLNKLPPPSFLKDTTHRVENVQKMNEIQERFTLPRLKMIKSPWEAALEGSVESAFQEINSPRGLVMAPTPTTLRKLATPTPPLPPSTPGPKDDLCKPKTPRAWNSHPACKSFNELPKSQPAKTCTPSLELTQPYLGLGSGAHLSPVPAVQVDLPANNFNTAPRGWQSSMSYYRPVTFATPNAAYTDF